MKLDDTWYTEICRSHQSAISLKIKEKLHEEKSPYQRIEVFETEGYGTLLTLDGLVMVTDKDNFVYHEMMAHPALYTHPDPKRVLIIGGGDCGTLREVLRHASVAEVHMVELDERVTRVAEQYFPELCESNNDPRVQFHFTDGIRWAAELEAGYYDVVIIDSTDPVGPAVGLFSESFYRDCYDGMSEKGVLIGQSESPLFDGKLIRTMHQTLRQVGFGEVTTLTFPQCTYPSGWWSATLAVKRGSLAEFRPMNVGNSKVLTRYYSSTTHRGALSMPPFLKRMANPD